jgi:hypothetical protein
LKKYVSILILLSAVGAFVLPFLFLLNFAHDDSFFYIKTASNLSKGIGSTFDGVNLTNGYHPLYLISLVMLFYVPNNLFNVSPELLYRLVVFFHLVMIIFTMYFTCESFKLILKDKFNNIVLSFLLVSLSVLVFIRDFGLESHLACLIVSYFFYLKLKEIETGKDNIMDKSVLLALLFLTRTDFLYSVIPLVLAADIFTETKRKKYIITSLSVLLITVVIYYLSNYISFGHFETVSGKMLNAFPVVLTKSNLNTLITDPAKLYNQFARIIFLFASTVLFVIYYFRLKNKDDKIRKYYMLVLSFGAGCILFTLYHLFFNNYSIREWYMTLPAFVSAIMITVIVSGKKTINYITLILSLIVLIYVFYGSRISNYKYDSGYKYAKALEQIVKEDESVYQVDYCGVTGFFSNRNIINGDGLINSFYYMEYLKKGKIDEYIEKYNVKYYSTYSSKSILQDSVYIDDNFSDKINGKIFTFDKSRLVLEKPFKWNHISFDMEGKWYLFKFN